MIVAKQLLPNNNYYGYNFLFLKYKIFAINKLTENISVVNIINTYPTHFLFLF